MLYYEIEVNLARKGVEPMWRSLVDDNDDVLQWITEAEARAVLADEARGDNARIMRFANGIGQPIL